MNRRWQANKIGLINFWYYDEQEFPFVKGRMLLRGSNGSGKSVTMQSVVPLLLDGNMSPERLDPFGSRDRKMSSYLLEENDGREERTGYLYLEFKRKDSETYLTIGMGIRARRGKPLDKWYFSLTDGRRIGKDFFLYKEMGEKVTLSKKELENRILQGGKVFDRQADYMEYVNKQIFGFETVDEYKEMVDLLIQLRTPKLSKDFKPSVINDILSDSLQPLSDEDLRPMSEAIENMDTMSMNLKSRKEAKAAAEKINAVFSKYNKIILCDKAARYEQTRIKLQEIVSQQKKYERNHEECVQKIEQLTCKIEQINAKREAMEKEKESLNKSDAVALKMRDSVLSKELEEQRRNKDDKEKFLASKQEQYVDAKAQIKDEEDRKFEKETEINSLLEDMQEEADTMGFQEFAFMAEELQGNIENAYKFELHKEQFKNTFEQISEGEDLLQKLQILDRQKEEMIQKRERQIREMDSIQRKISECEAALVQIENEWKESLYKWNEENSELKLEKDMLREFSVFADSYHLDSDFAGIRQKVADKWIEKKVDFETKISAALVEYAAVKEEIKETEIELNEWENQKEPTPQRSEAVVRNRKRLDDAKIPYQEFYKVIEFGKQLDEKACNFLEEALLKMGILDAIVVDEQYKEQVLVPAKGCEDCYLFASESSVEKSLLDVLELNEEVNDILSNYRMTGILKNIAYDEENILSVSSNGTYHMGILTGTITGEHEAGFLGRRARERQRQMKIDECKNQIAQLEERRALLEQQKHLLETRKDVLKSEFDQFPADTHMRNAVKNLLEEERKYEILHEENDKLGEELSIFLEKLKQKKKAVLEIAEKLYLHCSYDVFYQTKKAAERYDKDLTVLKSAHEMFLRSVEYLKERKEHLEMLDYDMDNLRYDIADIEKQIRIKKEEQTSIQKQLELTDYESIKERLDACVFWLHSYPEELQKCVAEKTKKIDEAKLLTESRTNNADKIAEYEKKMEYYQKCYEEERKLQYVAVPDEILEDAKHVYEYLITDVKNVEKDDVVRDLNRVYFENRGFLTEYQLTQNELFAESDGEQRSDEYLAKRLDITARYQGVKVSFSSLLLHLDEDISELESLIKDGDRELFEDILANTVSRKIRGKINASNAWVKKMNVLMNGMDTSSGLKLSLRWRSKTAEKEEQLDTRELVELLKKDYRLMSEEEAARLSAHFRSKVEEARRNARDSAGMISFYQIMKETLDYRKWFEFHMFFKKGEEQKKTLTNAAFNRFSGGEKAMAMYVPLFAAVNAQYKKAEKEDHPRIIALDEAFAGVDDKNISSMFELVHKLDFDYIMNSQALWGCFDTVRNLRIAELIRPQNSKTVSVIRYIWNGHERILDVQ